MINQERRGRSSSVLVGAVLPLYCYCYCYCCFIALFVLISTAPHPVLSYKENESSSATSTLSQHSHSLSQQRLLRASTSTSSSSTSTTPKNRRMPAVQRVYGSHNWEVRSEVRRLEERMPRYQTGFPSDLSHRVPYLHHPYEQSKWVQQQLRQRRRDLQDGSNATDDDASGGGNSGTAAPTTDTATTTTGNGTSAESSPQLFQPMRFKFFTEALDAIRDDTNGAKIDWYVNTILPKTADFWSRALSVVPVNGNLQISASELDSRVYCGDSEFTEVPTEHINDGVPDADLILYVSGSADSRFCPERTLAVAVPCTYTTSTPLSFRRWCLVNSLTCSHDVPSPTHLSPPLSLSPGNFDQFDRPTAGAVNVCLDNIELQDDGTATDGVVQDYVDVTVHEVGHVLGHSSNSYRFYWDPSTGEPRTPRPFEATTVTCVNGAERTLIMPAENTVKFVTTNTQTYATIVTEKVAAVARNQFDCQTLEGAFLENEPTREDSCIGDHWDERLFYPETMSPVISPTTNIFSSLTLALLEDSGWYKANYTVSSMSPWGLGAGCDFVNEPCLVPGSSSGDAPTIPDYGKGFFCNSEGAKGCSPELTTKMACTVLDYQYYVPEIAVPASFQYFAGETTMGGPQQADFCPVYGSPYSSKTAEQLDCRNPSNSGQFLNAYEYVRRLLTHIESFFSEN